VHPPPEEERGLFLPAWLLLLRALFEDGEGGVGRAGCSVKTASTADSNIWLHVARQGPSSDHFTHAVERIELCPESCVQHHLGEAKRETLRSAPRTRKDRRERARTDVSVKRRSVTLASLCRDAPQTAAAPSGAPRPSSPPQTRWQRPRSASGCCSSKATVSERTRPSPPWEVTPG